jgi:8-oxo-dGTP pyrophosphatase MutT (NUDIX family)
MKKQFSAGGVVFRKSADTIQILMGKHSQSHAWVFPKGLIGDKIDNEGTEETALREVEEETGVLGKIIAPLTPKEYWFMWEGEKIHKTVSYFLMEFISEDKSKKDDEMEEVGWITFDEVGQKLKYPSDKKIWEEAKQLLINQ